MKTNNKNVAAIGSLVAVPEHRAFGGIEPGSLRGNPFSIQPEVDHDAEILDRVKGMDGKEMRKFLKNDANRRAYDQALAAKGVRIE